MRGRGEVTSKIKNKRSREKGEPSKRAGKDSEGPKAGAEAEGRELGGEDRES